MVPRMLTLEDGFRRALDQSCQLAIGADTRQAAIAVHAKQSVQGSAIEDVLGAPATKQLLKGAVEVAGVTIHLITERIKGRFEKGPIMAAYVAPELLENILNDKRATDVIFLPWNSKEEASFYYRRHPTVLGAPEGWAPEVEEAQPEEEPPPAGKKEKASAVPSIREALGVEERVLPLEHTIDPGFVNHRRIETIVGEPGQAAIRQGIQALPDMPEWQKRVQIDHVYSSVMLAFCQTLGVAPLGKLLAERRGRLFCSTEHVGPCRNVYKVDQATNRLLLPGFGKVRAELQYSTAHISSDTLRMELNRGAVLSMIAELYSFEADVAVFRPLVMGGPWLVSPDPKWNAAAMWWGQTFYENVIEDVEEFSRVRTFPKPLTHDPMENISELAFKTCLAQIIGGDVPKDWGGETSDFFSAHLHVGGRRVSGAFLLKGPARLGPMRLNTLGKNNDQIVRLANEPADVLFLQHCHEVTAPVRATLRAFAVQPSRSRRYCVIDGRDSLWLLQAYELYDRALALSEGKVRRARG